MKRYFIIIYIITAVIKADDLYECKVALKDAKEKNKILLREIEKETMYDNYYAEDIKVLKNQLKAKEKIIKLKDKEIEKLKAKLSSKNAIIKDKQKEVFRKKQSSKEITAKSKASTYRTANEANIYDAINGKIVAKWEKGRSFTSYISSSNWIKITGYFIDKKWHRATNSLWIRKQDTFKRF
jgi:putative cell wall-binding protein